MVATSKTLSHHGAMAVFRILAGRADLDKIPFYVALPIGAFLGAFVGYAASMPGVGPKRIALLVGAFGLVAAFGMLAPRPARRGSASAASASPELPAASDPANDSLCD